MNHLTFLTNYTTKDSRMELPNLYANDINNTKYQINCVNKVWITTKKTDEMC